MARNGADFQVDVIGERELLLALEGFSSAAQRRIVRPAVRAASTPILRSARQNAPKKKGDRTGQLRRSLGRRMVTFKNSGVVIAIIGPRRKMKTTDKFGRSVNPTAYAHLVEFGTAPHMVGSRMHPGAQAKPFMRPAWVANQARSQQIMNATIRREIVKETNRAAAKAGSKRVK